jgi:hypothetical protein
MTAVCLVEVGPAFVVHHGWIAAGTGLPSGEDMIAGRVRITGGDAAALVAFWEGQAVAAEATASLLRAAGCRPVRVVDVLEMLILGNAETLGDGYVQVSRTVGAHACFGLFQDGRKLTSATTQRGLYKEGTEFRRILSEHLIQMHDWKDSQTKDDVRSLAACALATGFGTESDPPPEMAAVQTAPPVPPPMPDMRAKPAAPPAPRPSAWLRAAIIVLAILAGAAGGFLAGRQVDAAGPEGTTTAAMQQARIEQLAAQLKAGQDTLAALQTSVAFLRDAPNALDARLRALENPRARPASAAELQTVSDRTAKQTADIAALQQRVAAIETAAQRPPPAADLQALADKTSKQGADLDAMWREIATIKGVVDYLRRKVQ